MNDKNQLFTFERSYDDRRPLEWDVRKMAIFVFALAAQTEGPKDGACLAYGTNSEDNTVGGNKLSDQQV